MLSNIPKDKLLHNFYGVIIYVLLSFVNPTISICLVILAAIVKEIYDYVSSKGNPELLDILATIGLPIILYLKDVL